MEFLKGKFDELDEFLSKKGIVIPLIRDNGVPSVSLTLLIISYVIWICAVLEIQKNVDIDKCENMVWSMSALYFGRKISKTDKNKIQIDQPTQQDNKETQ